MSGELIQVKAKEFMKQMYPSNTLFRHLESGLGDTEDVENKLKYITEKTYQFFMKCF